MHVSSGRPSMLTSNHRGRGNEPVVVLGRIRSAGAVNKDSSLGRRISWGSGAEIAIFRETTLRGFHLGIIAALLLDQIVFDSALTLGCGEQLFPRRNSLSEQHAISL